MISFDKYENCCKTLYIKFKCIRCKTEVFESLKECDKRTGDRGCYLSQLSMPDGWYDDNLKGIALCPNCKKAFEKFLSNEMVGANNGNTEKDN